jgi:hypothetical protein
VRTRAGHCWRLENLKSFDEFLERRFPESRRKAPLVMSIHEHLPRQARKDLKEVAGRRKKGFRAGEGGAGGGSGIRLCNLVAQGPGDAEGRIQAGSRKGTDWAGLRTA